MGPKSNLAKVCDAAYRENEALRLLFLRDTEVRELPGAMPKEASAKAGEEESIIRDAERKQ